MKAKIGTIALILTGIALAGLAIGGMLIEWSGGWIPRSGHNRIIKAERTFSGTGLTAIDLDTIEADVYCRPGRGDQIQVRLSGRTNQGEPPELFANLKGGVLGLKVWPNRKTMNMSSAWAHLEVIVPDSLRFDLDVHTVSGDVRLEDLRLKKLDVRTVSGDLQARGVTAAATKLRTASGDYEMEGIPGDLYFHGISGDLDVRYLEFDNALELSAASGNIRLDLPPASRFVLEASSASGEITSGFPLTIAGGREQHHLQGVVGDGTNRIKITTISGGIRLD